MTSAGPGAPVATLEAGGVRGEGIRLVAPQHLAVVAVAVVAGAAIGPP